jgi:hypothetical protein
MAFTNLKKCAFLNSAMESSSELFYGRRPLPLELNCEIFKCLPEPIQRKYIWGLGRGIYGAFRRKLLFKVILHTIGRDLRQFYLFLRPKDYGILGKTGGSERKRRTAFLQTD